MVLIMINNSNMNINNTSINNSRNTTNSIKNDNNDNNKLAIFRSLILLPCFPRGPRIA